MQQAYSCSREVKGLRLWPSGAKNAAKQDLADAGIIRADLGLAIPMATTQPTNVVVVTPPGSAERLQSLDFFRGLTIAGMILVNNNGDSKAAYRAAAAFPVEWLDAHGPGLPVLPLHRGCFDGVLVSDAPGSRRVARLDHDACGASRGHPLCHRRFRDQ